MVTQLNFNNIKGKEDMVGTIIMAGIRTRTGWIFISSYPIEIR